MIHGHHNGGPESLEVVDVGFKVAEPLFESLHIGFADFRQRHTSVPVQRAKAGDKHSRRRRQARSPALDVVELLGTEV